MLLNMILEYFANRHIYVLQSLDRNIHKPLNSDYHPEAMTYMHNDP
jgi:hypothetical protein